MDSVQLGADSAPPQENAYSYTRGAEFTSENFKVEITNLPRFYGMVQFRKMMKNQLNIEPHKLKPVAARGCLFATFSNEEKRLQAVKLLNGYEWKKYKLSARCVSAVADPYRVDQAKRVLEEEGEANPKNKKIRFDEGDFSVETKLRDVTVPWWNVEYDEQLKRKNSTVQEFIKQYKQKLRTLNFPLFNWLCRKDDGENDVKVDPILPSPVIDKYRNKCEFTVGSHPITDQRVVGFRLGSYKQSSVGVVSPEGLPHVPDCMQRAVRLFQDYLERSQYAPFSPVDRRGHWRQLLVRCARGGDTMLVVQFVRQQLSEQAVDDEQRRLVEFLTGSERAGEAGLAIRSIYWQTQVQKVSAEQITTSPDKQLLYGDKFLSDRLFDLQLRVSPEAFLQVNSAAAEVLYRAVFQMASVGKDSTVLDVCCGTGTIGLSFASFLRQQLTGASDDEPISCRPSLVSSSASMTTENSESADKDEAMNSADSKLSAVCQVLGVEMVPEAVADAVANASANSLSGCCRFFVGRAEKLLPPLLHERCGDTARPGADVVAVVDPPRAGLGRQVTQALRRCPALHRLVYVACDPNQALANLLDLARPASKHYRRKPFVVRRAVPVDLFPHTPNVELALLLERCDGTGRTEEERDNTEQERDNTEQERDNTEQERDNTEQNRDNTEQERDNTEQERDNTDQEWDFTEQERDNTQQERDNTELERNNTEQERNNTNQEMDNTEQERDNTEQERDNTEQERDNTQQEMDNTEQERDNTTTWCTGNTQTDSGVNTEHRENNSEDETH